MKYIFEEKTAQVKGLKYKLPRAEVKPASLHGLTVNESSQV